MQEAFFNTLHPYSYYLHGHFIGSHDKVSVAEYTSNSPWGGGCAILKHGLLSTPKWALAPGHASGLPATESRASMIARRTGPGGSPGTGSLY